MQFSSDVRRELEGTDNQEEFIERLWNIATAVDSSVKESSELTHRELKSMRAVGDHIEVNMQGQCTTEFGVGRSKAQQNFLDKEEGDEDENKLLPNGVVDCDSVEELKEWVEKWCTDRVEGELFCFRAQGKTPNGDLYVAIRNHGKSSWGVTVRKNGKGLVSEKGVRTRWNVKRLIIEAVDGESGKSTDRVRKKEAVLEAGSVDEM